MARIRSIKPEFWVSEQVADCSPNARLTFVGLWNFSDDNGVHPASPKKLKAELYPMDDITSAEVAKWIQELINAGLVASFEADGATFWHVTGWARHQKIDRPSFKFPAPPDHAVSSTTQRALADSFPEPSPNVRRAPPPGEEGSGEEGSGEEKAASPKARSARSEEDSSSRLPKDWTLPEEWRRHCAETRPDLDPEAVAEGFRDHWLAQPGKDGRKADWLATWRNWVKREHVGTANRGRRSLLHADDDFREVAR